jgi:secondary thiamine-phosphate synthase enzyme
MIEGRFSRFYREMVHTPRQDEMDAADLTPFIREIVRRSKIANGYVQLFVVGSTGAIVSVEFEEGMLQDLKDVLDRLIPRGRDYHHERAWGDGNAHSHLRAAVLGPDMTVPVTDGKLNLGTWQQIAVVNLDNRPRDRTVVVTVVGE